MKTNRTGLVFFTKTTGFAESGFCLDAGFFPRRCSFHHHAFLCASRVVTQKTDWNFSSTRCYARMLVVDTTKKGRGAGHSPQVQQANEELNHWRSLFRYAKREFSRDKGNNISGLLFLMWD
jgi:hypothetical protein